VTVKVTAVYLLSLLIEQLPKNHELFENIMPMSLFHESTFSLCISVWKNDIFVIFFYNF